MLTAGTSDGAGRRRGRRDAGRSGVGCRRVDDVGVAGVHRVLAVAPDLAEADAVVVVAGMDGALPSVVAGLTDRLVVAVPTSVGYGAAFEGLAALLTMLTACAPGVLVVNIDNGFGAGVAAARIVPDVGSAVADGVGQQLVHRARPEPARVDLDPRRSRPRRRAARAGARSATSARVDLDPGDVVAQVAHPQVRAPARPAAGQRRAQRRPRPPPRGPDPRPTTGTP